MRFISAIPVNHVIITFHPPPFWAPLYRVLVAELRAGIGGKEGVRKIWRTTKKKWKMENGKWKMENGKKKKKKKEKGKTTVLRGTGQSAVALVQEDPLKLAQCARPDRAAPLDLKFPKEDDGGGRNYGVDD
ncbi:hypothetical protein ACKS0A_08468 [Histoplasma ohiense]